MLRPVMAQILAAVAPKEHTSIAKQASTGDFPAYRPAGRAIGGDIAHLSGAPERTSNGRGAAEKTAGNSNSSGLVEHIRSIGFGLLRPAAGRPGQVAGSAERKCPRRPQISFNYTNISRPERSNQNH